MSELWRELHTRALDIKTDDSMYIRQFRLNIPRYTHGCKCNEFWANWSRLNPPVYGDGYFAWTVKAHNAVNYKLGKPTYTVEEARKFFSK